MLLAQQSCLEVEQYLATSRAIIIPLRSTEQHGPLGLIGTDAICAERIAAAVGAQVEALVAPTLAYTPAEFNLGFPGTVSVSVETYSALLTDVITSLARHGLSQIYFLNGHGANLAPLREVMCASKGLIWKTVSWWDYLGVNKLRQSWYGVWEGIHATPSEVAITRSLCRVIDDPELAPPEQLSVQYLRDHTGDRHGPPSAHRARFPDGRVGSHSALGTVEHGERLLATAVAEGAADFRDFVGV
jgi:creatinine amidohydrolase